MPEALKIYQKPKLAKHEFDSSQIAEYEYEAASSTLYMRFRSNAAKLTYAYANFPADKAAELDASDSKGSFFYKHIKNQYDFDRLPGTDPAQYEYGKPDAAAA